MSHTEPLPLTEYGTAAGVEREREREGERGRERERERER